MTDVIHTEEFTREELLETAYSLENNSEHPLAKAIVQYCEKSHIGKQEGYGISVEDRKRIVRKDKRLYRRPPEI